MIKTVEINPKYEVTPEGRNKLLNDLGRFSLIGMEIEDNLANLKHGFKDAILHPIQWSRDSYFIEDYKRQQFLLGTTEKIARLALEGQISTSFYENYASLAVGFRPSSEA